MNPAATKARLAIEWAYIKYNDGISTKAEYKQAIERALNVYLADVVRAGVEFDNA